MNILIITANDNSIGGASRISMDLHSAYLRKGHNSVVLAGKKTTDNPYVKQIKRPLLNNILSRILSNDIDFFNTDYILQLSDFINADIVHCHNIEGWYFNLSTLKKMSKLKKVVWTLHDMWSINPHSGYTSSTKIRNGLFTVSDSNNYPKTLWNNNFYLSWRKSFLYKRMDLNIVTPCKWLEKLVKETSLGKHKIDVIYNGIDTKIFTRKNNSLLRKNLNIPYKKIVTFIGFNAISNNYKGYLDFLWLANKPKNKDLQFVCIGADHDYELNNIRYVKATNDQKTISDYLSVSNVFLMPSRFETFPLVLLEAMACGTPVAAYNVGGVSELLADREGCMLVTKKNKCELDYAMNSLLELEGIKLEKISLALRAFILQKFTKDIMSNSYLNLFKLLK